jgi:hypothetical protein
MAKAKDELQDTAKGSPSDLRGERLQGGRGRESRVAQQSGGTSVAMSGALTEDGTVIQLTLREIYLHQAGQALGEAELYKRLAKQYEQTAQEYARASQARYKTASDLYSKARGVSQNRRVGSVAGSRRGLLDAEL